MQEGDYLNIILTQYYSSPNLDLYLYDKNQNTIVFNWSSYDTKTLNHICEYTGIYYIRVDKFGFLEDNKYTLQLIGPQKTTPTPTAGFLFIPIIIATLPLVYIIRKRKLNK
jgi:hypothetical protein